MDLPKKQGRLKVSELRFQELKKVEREHESKLKARGIIKGGSRHSSSKREGKKKKSTSKINKSGSLASPIK